MFMAFALWMITQTSCIRASAGIGPLPVITAVSSLISAAVGASSMSQSLVSSSSRVQFRSPGHVAPARNGVGIDLRNGSHTREHQHFQNGAAVAQPLAWKVRPVVGGFRL